MISQIFKVGFKKTYLFFLLIPGLLIILFFLNKHYFQSARPEIFSTTLIHMSNLNGYLDPSGCMFHPLGGLAHTGTVIRKIIKDNPNHLIFDTGDTLFGIHDLNLDFEENKQDIKILRGYAEKIIDVFNHWGVFAATVGDHDLGGGYDEWVNLQKRATYPIISINAKDEDGIIKPYIIKYFKGIKILITGVTGTYTAAPYFITTDKIKFSDYVEPLSSLIEKENADLVIVLSHSGILFDRLLTNDIKKIDIILGAHSMGYAGVIKENNTLIVHNGKNGQYLSKINIKMELDKKTNTYSKEILPDLIEIDPKLPEDKDIVKILKKNASTKIN